MHLNRWLTSIILLPLVIFLIVKGGMPFFVFICAVCVTSLREYFSITFHKQGKNHIINFLGLVMGLLIIWAAFRNDLMLMLWLFSFDLLGCATISVILSKPDSPLIDSVFRQVQGLMYIALFLGFLVLLRNQKAGETWILLILCVIFAGDTGAYYVGTYLGKHKLIPRVSPGKTIEGALGGLAANAIVGGGINYALPFLPWGLNMQRLPWLWATLFFMVIGAVGQLGDLYESQLKRAAGMKDSGKILPGHGGILDRIDALLFALPIAFVFKMTVF